jgi:hypothetical protein
MVFLRHSAYSTLNRIEWHGDWWMINYKCGAGWRSQYSDWATGWTLQGSNSSRDKIFFYSRNRPDRLWGPSGLLFLAYRRLLPLGNAAGA